MITVGDLERELRKYPDNCTLEISTSVEGCERAIFEIVRTEKALNDDHVIVTIG